MNGFEPLRRRIIDYTDAGQWSEVYDGPVEDCESEKLKAENAKLRELCAELLDNLMPEVCAKAYWCSDKDWKACGDHACGNQTFVILARELGMVVNE